MDTTYNPLTEAAKVAISELTCDKAKRFYALKAQRDTQDTIEGALILLRGLYLIARFAFDCGITMGQWHHTALTAIVRANEPKPLALTGVQPVALLRPATGKIRRLPSRVGPQGAALVTRPATEVLEGLTVKQLRGMIRRAGRRPKSGAKKAELLNLPNLSTQMAIELSI